MKEPANEGLKSIISWSDVRFQRQQFEELTKKSTLNQYRVFASKFNEIAILNILDSFAGFNNDHEINELFSTKKLGSDQYGVLNEAYYSEIDIIELSEIPPEKSLVLIRHFTGNLNSYLEAVNEIFSKSDNFNKQTSVIKQKIIKSYLLGHFSCAYNISHDFEIINDGNKIFDSKKKKKSLYEQIKQIKNGKKDVDSFESSPANLKKQVTTKKVADAIDEYFSEQNALQFFEQNALQVLENTDRVSNIIQKGTLNNQLADRIFDDVTSNGVKFSVDQHPLVSKLRKQIIKDGGQSFISNSKKYSNELAFTASKFLFDENGEIKQSIKNAINNNRNHSQGGQWRAFEALYEKEKLKKILLTAFLVNVYGDIQISIVNDFDRKVEEVVKFFDTINVTDQNEETQFLEIEDKLEQKKSLFDKKIKDLINLSSNFSVDNKLALNKNETIKKSKDLTLFSSNLNLEIKNEISTEGLSLIPLIDMISILKKQHLSKNNMSIGKYFNEDFLQLEESIIRALKIAKREKKLIPTATVNRLQLEYLLINNKIILEDLKSKANKEKNLDKKEGILACRDSLISSISAIYLTLDKQSNVTTDDIKKCFSKIETTYNENLEVLGKHSGLIYWILDSFGKLVFHKHLIHTRSENLIHSAIDGQEYISKLLTR